MRKFYELRKVSLMSGAPMSSEELGAFDTEDQAHKAMECWQKTNPRWHFSITYITAECVHRTFEHLLKSQQMASQGTKQP